jgi:hypothetical protein
MVWNISMTIMLTLYCVDADTLLCAGDVVGWYADAEFQVRAALAMNPADGSKTLRVRQGPDAAWTDLITWPQEEEGSVLCFAKDGRCGAGS